MTAIVATMSIEFPDPTRRKTMFRFRLKAHRSRDSLRLAALAGLAVLGAATAQAQDGSPNSATTPDGKVRIDIVSFKRTEGDTATLRFQVSNNGNQTYIVVAGNMRLIDMVGRRIYTPGIVSSNCSAAVGQRLACYAVFAAPPSGTQKVNVQFYEQLDLISGIPVSE